MRIERRVILHGKGASAAAVDVSGRLPYICLWEGWEMGRVLRVRRLEARVTSEVKDLIERAAQLRGTSVTDFVVASTQQAATATIQEFERLRLQDEARKAFVDALLNPPAPNKAARSAAARYRKRVGR